MHPLIWLGAALGGVAFWRRKHLKDDAEKVSAAAKNAKVATTERIAAARSGDSGEADSGVEEGAAADAGQEAADEGDDESEDTTAAE
jgi:hypothetical protein